jgi:hypothetical protein
MDAMKREDCEGTMSVEVARARDGRRDWTGCRIGARASRDGANACSGYGRM